MCERLTFCFLFLAAGLLVARGTLAAEDAAANKTTGGADKSRSLDDLLLDDLKNDLLDGSDATGPKTKPDRAPAAPADSKSGLDEALLRQLGEGEDLGQEVQDPLLLISRRMRAVENLIGQQNTAQPTQQLQKQIVEDLGRLIEQMKKQCSSGQCDGGGRKKPGSKPGSGGKAGAGHNRGKSRPAKDSTSRMGKQTDRQVEVDRLKRMLKEVWGHLPPKIREQVQNASPEEFLPKYEKLIEDYYKRLAEEERSW